jgi:ArsR family transcriptional regulator
VLVVEGDPQLGAALVDALREVGIAVRISRSAGEALGIARRVRGIELVMLDVRAPGVDALELCRLVRSQGATALVPVTILSARRSRAGQLLALELELRHAVRRLRLEELADLCKTALAPTERRERPLTAYRDESFAVDFDDYVARHPGRPVSLTRSEFRALRCLLERPGRAVSREELVVRLRTGDAHGRSRNVDGVRDALAPEAGPGPLPYRDRPGCGLPVRGAPLTRGGEGELPLVELAAATAGRHSERGRLLRGHATTEYNRSVSAAGVDHMFRAFSDRTRLRILSILKDHREACVGDLVAVLGAPQTTVSRHLAYLRRAGLVRVRKEGLWKHYSLAPAEGRFHRRLLHCLGGCFDEVRELAGDRKRYQRLKGCCPE